jgi:hypothetical protein
MDMSLLLAHCPHTYSPAFEFALRAHPPWCHVTLMNYCVCLCYVRGRQIMRYTTSSFDRFDGTTVPCFAWITKAQHTSSRKKKR